MSAPKLASHFVQEIARLHGIPRSIISDKDKLFVSTFWKDLFRLQGTSLKYSIAYHPQTDCQSEVLNRCLETFLLSFFSNNPKKWVDLLPWAELW